MEEDILNFRDKGKTYRKIENLSLKELLEVKAINLTIYDIIACNLHIGSLTNFSAVGTSWSWSYMIRDHSIFNLRIIYFNLKLLLKKLNWRASFFADIVYANFNKALVDYIEQWALKTGVMYVVGRWFRGGITNFYHFYSFLQKCRFDIAMFRKYSKFFCGLFKLSKIPEVLFLSSNKDNFSRSLVKEAFCWNSLEMWLLNDSLVDPKYWSFIIPGNEKSKKSLSYIYGLFYNQILLGKFESLRFKSLVKDDEPIIYNDWVSFLKVFDKQRTVSKMINRGFFNSQFYLNRFFTWFSYMRQRALDRNVNKLYFRNWVQRWGSRVRRFYMPRGVNFSRISRRRKVQIEHFRWKTIYWFKRINRMLLKKMFTHKKKYKVRGFSRRRRRALKSVLNVNSTILKRKTRSRFYRQRNYMKKIKKFKKSMIFYDRLKQYNLLKNLNFFDFYKRMLRKSQTMNMLFQNEFDKELSFTFDRDNKLGSLIWEYFNGRSIESWWELNKDLHRHKGVLAAAHYLKREDQLRSFDNTKAIFKAVIDRVASETFSFRKVILKNNYFRNRNKKFIFHRNMDFINIFLNFERNCLKNENYFKKNNKLTVISYNK